MEKSKAGIPAVEYHADDYGLFPTQSERILKCHQKGKLNGISIMPNSDSLEICMELLRPYQKEIAATVHLNLMEGKGVCPPEEIPLLTDPAGTLKGSFCGLLLHSFLPGRKKYREQLKKEIREQIFRLMPYLPEGQPLRLDGHAHYHMIPVVFDAMMDVIREEKLNVSYIRIPREYPMLYLRHWRKLKDFPVINLAKVAILNLLTWRNERKYRDYLQSLTRNVFLGVFLSGHMYRESVEAVLPDAIRLAGKLGWGIEILAHPGGVYEERDAERLTSEQDVQFLSSRCREREALMFMDG